MSHIAVSGLAYAHPGGDLLFSDVSFRVPPGRHAGLVGRNGVGKSTLMAILAGRLTADDGDAAAGGRVGYMPQDVGVDDGGLTVRELLLGLAPASLAAAGRRVLAAERELERGEDPDAGVRLGTAIADYAALGGYELEGQWDVATRRLAGAAFGEICERPAVSLSGGERKRLVLEVLLASDADVLLLDEPDNFLDVPAKLELERRLRETRKTVLVISHDRQFLTGAVDSIVTLEGDGAWVHGGSYETYAEARAERRRHLGDALARWQAEERRLYQLMKTFKERARYSDVWAKKAQAAETRWRHFKEAGPPPEPVTDRAITVRLRGGDCARRVLDLRGVGIEGLVLPFSDEIRFGERIGLIGPNGSGKSSLLEVLAGRRSADEGEVVTGPRVSPGFFTQLQTRPDLVGRGTLEIILERTGERQRAMAALARYGLADADRRPYEVLSGGEKARLEILVLELEGHNLLLLDEPTDNLDVDSAEALESALEEFEGTVLAISHDRAFLQRMSRYVMVMSDGCVLALPSWDIASAALAEPELAGELRLAKLL